MKHLRALTWDRRRKDLDLRDPGVGVLHSALTAPATAEELQGEADALALYRTSSAGRPSVARRLRRPVVLSSLLSSKLLTAAAAGAVGLGGATTAAYAGALPSSLQDVAHSAIGAPRAHGHGQGLKHGVGPDATGSAAWGLCQAFAKDKAAHGQQPDGTDETSAPEPQQSAHGRSDQAPGRAKQHGNPHATADGTGPGNSNAGNGNGNGKALGRPTDRPLGKEGSVAYRNLAAAAGGADKIDEYCAKVPRPSGAPEPSDDAQSSAPKAGRATPARTPAAKGKPSDVPASPEVSTAPDEPTDPPTVAPTSS